MQVSTLIEFFMASNNKQLYYSEQYNTHILQIEYHCESIFNGDF